MIVDVITFNGEDELFEIRYNILSPYVDEFRVIEFDKTFSGKTKGKKFNQKWDKVKHYFITEEVWSKYWEEAKKSPNTNYGKGAKHWLREWCMKESIKECLTDLCDGDIIYLGDVDEIVDTFSIKILNFCFKYIPQKGAIKLKLKVYAYWLNNLSSEEFWGTIVAKYKFIKESCLNHIRSTEHIKVAKEVGWHFTSIGGYDKLKEKLTDSYTEETYANKQVLNNLEKNIKENKDFLGRDFVYKKDELDWPKYLVDNKEKYKHLLR